MAYAFVALLWILIWVISLNSTALLVHGTNQTGRTSGNSHPQKIQTAASRATGEAKDDDMAQEIPGMDLEIPFQDQPGIQIIYPASLTPKSVSKGLVLLLHACTHSALKFFSPSPETCPDCVGLSEELRIVRLVLREGYTPVAISCLDRKSGCWSNADIPRVKQVLNQELFSGHKNVYAMGASSGGAFVAELVAQELVQAGLVMVMGLGPRVVNKLQAVQKPIYLAPMPRDEGTTRRASQNYHTLKNHAILDTTSCKSLPVTTRYLMQRVPDMTKEAADRLIVKLQQANHIDPNTNMLMVDPTRSNWRDLVSPNNATHYAGKLALKPGYSPLAKALHRAWAFHEYCCEVVIPALRFFEQHT
jgi:hypothetical protein